MKIGLSIVLPQDTLSYLVNVLGIDNGPDDDTQ